MEIAPLSPSFITRASSSFWLMPSAFRAFEIAWPKSHTVGRHDWSITNSPCQSACSRIGESLPDIYRVDGVVTWRFALTGNLGKIETWRVVSPVRQSRNICLLLPAYFDVAVTRRTSPRK